MNQPQQNPFGKVESVDTGNVVIKVIEEQKLNSIQVNNLLRIRSTKTGEAIIGLVIKIMRKSSDKVEPDNPEEIIVENVVKACLVGTLLDKYGTKSNVFKRTLETVPSLDADCFLIEGEELSQFMKSLSVGDEEKEKSLNIGRYVISEDAKTYLDGNKFFQRHAVIVGSTGSGKSWTVAKILEKSSQLQSVNSIVFDIHGEYKPLSSLDNTTLLKVAGPTDNADNEKIIYLPYWLLSYEEIMAMMLDRSDQNAPNQARALFDLVINYKKQKLKENDKQDILNNFTIDSPVPYSIDEVLKELDKLDTERVQGSTSKGKAGPLNGKLTRFIQRLKSKQSDKRLNFLFNNNSILQKHEWLENLVEKLMDFNNKKGNKIVDFSEVPSDILPLITGLVTRLIFSVQQWTDEDKRHPIALFCDEAHLYIPTNTEASSIEERGLYNFQRVAKEGRKYGLSLVVISQRPADVSKTVLSQCGNFISMKLSNPDDQNVIRRLFPDSLGNFAELLPILDIGESLIVGDACLLPSRVKIDEPKIKPDSATIDFWDEWKKDKQEKGIKEALEDLRRQSKSK
ncbi:MAG: ATP-binding protein [Bdellovibrionales bacterium]|nr:ATP-binding protein [Bdellovibrionales bacterium]